MDVLESNAEKVRKLSGAELYCYQVGHGLFGIGLGAMFARHFPEFSLLCGFGGIVLGAVLMIVGGKGMFKRSS